MTTQSQATSLTKANLHSIFGERNPQTRLSNIAKLWVPSSDVLFVDPTGVFKTHEAISEMVNQILAMSGPDDVFSELNEVECLQKDVEGDLWVTRVKWGVGPPEGEYVMTGWDVLTIVGGKIKACYTFLDSKS